MICVNVPVSTGAYEISIEAGLLDRAGGGLSAYAGRKAAVVADARTADLFGRRVLAALAGADIQGSLIVVPRGEHSKSLRQLSALYDAFLRRRVSRRDLIIALGGGVVGDLTGYAAASFLRGVPLLQMPTTLLSMVDSSVGGKVAVNLPRGKNLVGAFYQPVSVLIDPDTLRTLDPREMNAGLCEVIKYGAILDATLFDRIEQAGGWDGLKPRLPEIIADCCRLKARVVAEDPLDTGVRMILNYGHTLGHAIEQHSGYGVLHGEAVGIGMVAAARLGEQMSITAPGTAARLEAVLRMYGIETAHKAPAAELAEILALDKKAAGAEVTVVLLTEIGKCRLEKLPLAQAAKLAECLP